MDETPKRKGLRLTKQQKAYQEQVLVGFVLRDEFTPSSSLVSQLALALKMERNFKKDIRESFDAYKRRSILSLAWERIFK
jgi:hypothetical protein